MKIAVVTGASSGMGREFVKQLDAAHSFDEIWVIARRRDRLVTLADEVKAAIRPICLDLSAKESYDEYAALLAAEKPVSSRHHKCQDPGILPIKLKIAGISQAGPVTQIDDL